MQNNETTLGNFLNVLGGQESIKIAIGIDTGSAVMLFFALFLSIVLAGIIIKKVGN